MRQLRVGNRELSQPTWEIEDLARDFKSWSDRDARLIAEGGSLMGGRREAVETKVRAMRVDLTVGVLLILLVWFGLIGMVLGLWIASGGR